MVSFHNSHQKDTIMEKPTFEFAVFHHACPQEPHRGPFATEAEAQEWVREAEEDGMKPGVFVVMGRQVNPWQPA